MDESRKCQVIMATHSPLLMAYPGATLLQLTRHSLDSVKVEDTQRFRTMREFFTDPAGFVEAAFWD
jgi:predicted ATPase